MMDVLHPEAAKAHGHAHKDKLAATKKHDAEVHEALKAAEKAEKEKREKEAAEAAKAYKQERAYKVEADPDQKHSKRALREAHEAAKKAEKDEGPTCEHGVHKCRICFPHKLHKELDHPHERAPVPSKFADE